MLADAEEFLRRVEKSGRAENAFDIVYFDPPYSSDYRFVLDQLAVTDEKILREDGIVVVEHHHKNELPDLIWNLRRWRILKQGDSSLSFYERS